MSEASGIVATAHLPQLTVVMAYRQLQFAGLNAGSMQPSRYVPLSADEREARTQSQRMNKSTRIEHDSSVKRA